MQTQPINFHPPATEASFSLPPDSPSLFAERAKRFQMLAEGHSLSDWLLFLGRLTEVQHRVLQSLPELPLPDTESLKRAQLYRMPPLHFASLTRPPVWRDVLREIVQYLLPHVPAAGKDTLDMLLAASDEALETLADVLLTGEPEREQLAQLPLIAASLQVVFTALASRPDIYQQIQPLEAHGVCPCCGSPPVSSLVRLGSEINNLRYLHCSLCNTEWNVPRAVCSVCNTDEKLSLHELAGQKGEPMQVVRAETCDSCKSYLKIAYQEKDPHVDPVADDLATLSLDMLVDEAGYERSGFNMLIIGANT